MANHNINNQLKATIREKRGNECERCGKKNGPKNKPKERLQLHHKTPICYGGSNKQSNLILLCKKCHDKAHMEYYGKKLGSMKKTYKELIDSGQYRVNNIH